MALTEFRLTAVAALALACAAPAFAQGAADRATGLKLDGDQPIQIESDKLEVFDEQHKAVFTGNVSVEQGKTLLKSGRMTVYYAKGEGSVATGQGAIERLEVEGKVYVKTESQVATGDQGTFDMKSEVLVLTGKEVVLSEGDNVIVGCKLTVQMKNGRAKLDGCGGTGGRIKMLITPNAAKRS